MATFIGSGKNISAATLTSIAATVSFTVQAGDLVLVNSNFATPSFSDDLGHTWTSISALAASSSRVGASAYCIVTTGGASITITASGASRTYASLVATVWRPTAGYNLVLDSQSAYIDQNGGIPPLTSGAITTTAAVIAIGLFTFANGSVNPTAGNIGGTAGTIIVASPANQGGATQMYISVSSQLVSATAALTNGTGTGGVASVVAFAEQSSVVNVTITCRGITLGGTGGTSQEVSVGGIG